MLNFVLLNLLFFDLCSTLQKERVFDCFLFVEVYSVVSVFCNVFDLNKIFSFRCFHIIVSLTKHFLFFFFCGAREA